MNDLKIGLTKPFSFCFLKIEEIINDILLSIIPAVIVFFSS